MERRVSTDGISESRVGMRAYAKGRTFDTDRYPTTPYHDPDDIIREKREASKGLKAAEASQPKETKSAKQKKQKGPAQEELPRGMTLNEPVHTASEQEGAFAPSEDSTGMEESAKQNEE